MLTCRQHLTASDASVNTAEKESATEAGEVAVKVLLLEAPYNSASVCDNRDHWCLGQSVGSKEGVQVALHTSHVQTCWSQGLQNLAAQHSLAIVVTLLDHPEGHHEAA